MNLFSVIIAFLARLLGIQPSPKQNGDSPEVLSPRVLVINIDPIVDDQGTHLTTKMGWNNIDDLISQFIADISEVSYGLVNYQYDKANRIDINEFPIKADGFQYNAGSYISMMQDESTHHEPDRVDYQKIINDCQLFYKIMSNQIDEVWVFNGPWFGFLESTMAGKNAIGCNSSPLTDTDICSRRFVIMGFSYQRGVAQMLHDIGHRMESIMAYVYNSINTLDNAYNSVNLKVIPPIGPDKFVNPKNDFERFMLFEKIAPGRAEMGLVHTPPNADKDYDWHNSNTVSSTSDDWLNYPLLQGTQRMINCDEWTCGPDEYGFMKWWFKHVPHVKGSKNGILNNWWKYTMQVDKPFNSSH